VAVAQDSNSASSQATSVGTFSWSHAAVGTPAGVLVFCMADGNATDIFTGVTYGGVSLDEVTGGFAQDTAGEIGCCKAYFLGAGITTGTQTIEVTRTNNATITWACAAVVTAGDDTSYAGVFTEEEDQTLSEESVDDGSPGENSVRFMGLFTGGNSPRGSGLNSSRPRATDFGATSAGLYVEDVAGQGSRLVGADYGTSDDVAAIYLAIIEGAGGGATEVRPGPLQKLGSQFSPVAASRLNGVLQ
jgi:hypothetical protein